MSICWSFGKVLRREVLSWKSEVLEIGVWRIKGESYIFFTIKEMPEGGKNINKEAWKHIEEAFMD